MKKSIKRALEDPEKRLDDLLPEIERRQKEVAEKALDEPEHLKSGISIDEVEVKRAIKEQENEDPSE